MKLVADENVDRQIVELLRSHRFEVEYIAELAPGIGDSEVLRRSHEADAVPITADKDFGEIVFRQRRLSAGVLLLRLAGLDPLVKAARVIEVVTTRAAELAGSFSVLSANNLRIRRGS